MGMSQLLNNYPPHTDPYTHPEQADFDLWSVDSSYFFLFYLPRFTDSGSQATIDAEVQPFSVVVGFS